MFFKKIIVLFFIFFFSNVFAEDTSQNIDPELQSLMKTIDSMNAKLAKMQKKDNKVSIQIGGDDEKDTPNITLAQDTKDDIAQNFGGMKVDRSLYDKDREELALKQIMSGKTGDPIQSVDISDSVAPITTRGQTTYVGAYSSSNTVPLGRISSNLFPATIVGQRQFAADYSTFIAAYIENDYQDWFGSALTGVDGTKYPANGQGAYLSTLFVYFMANLGHYTTALIDIEVWQLDAPSIGDAFVTFGNIDTSPWFVSVGQYRPSVGTFGGGGPWTYSITTNMFRPNRVPNLAVNYKGDTATSNIAVFNSGNHPSFSVGYFDAISLFNMVQTGFSAGYVYDNRGLSSRFDNISTRVGQFDVDATLNLENIIPGSWNLGVGWATTTTKSSQYNGYSNTRAGAFSLQTAYAFKLFGKGQNINLSYGQTYDANNIPFVLPTMDDGMTPTPGIHRQYIVSTQRAYLDDNVLVGPEYSRQELYNHQKMNTFTLDLIVYI